MDVAALPGQVSSGAKLEMGGEWWGPSKAFGLYLQARLVNQVKQSMMATSKVLVTFKLFSRGGPIDTGIS